MPAQRSASSRAASTRTPRSYNSQPSGVSFNWRVERFSKRAPRRCSSRATSLLTADGVMPQARAAAENPPSSITRTKISSSPERFTSSLAIVNSSWGIPHHEVDAMKRLPTLAASTLLAFALSGPAHADPASGWIASWTASPQAVWGQDFLFPSNVPATLDEQTVRQVARISLGGKRVRIVLSNAYGRTPLTIKNATVALAGAASAIDQDSLRAITFGGQASATIAAGAPLVSDPIALSVPDLARLTVSLHLPRHSEVSTFHWDGRATAWIAPGDQTRATHIDAEQAGVHTTTARLVLSAIEVEVPVAAPAAAPVVAV